MKNLDDIDTKIIMEERKITIKRLQKTLDEFKMYELEMKLNAEIKILKHEENKIRNIINLLKN